MILCPGASGWCVVNVYTAKVKHILIVSIDFKRQAS